MVLEVSDLAVAFYGTRVVEALNFRLKRGEALAIVGGNGSGKTTVLNAISGSVTATGRIALLGTDLQGLQPWIRARMGLARTLQTARGFVRLTQGEDLALTQWASERQPSTSWIRRIGDAISSVRGMSCAPEVTGATVQELQLIGALLGGSFVALLDEPFAGLAKRRKAWLKNAMRSHKEAGRSIIIVEHHVSDALDVVEHVLELENGRQTFYGERRAYLEERRRGGYAGRGARISH